VALPNQNRKGSQKKAVPVGPRSPICLIHRFLESRKLEHVFSSEVEGIFIKGLNSDEFNITIEAHDNIVQIDRTSTSTGDPNWTKSFKLELADPELFDRLRKILCP
jgi:hypothetical protein